MGSIVAVAGALFLCGSRLAAQENSSDLYAIELVPTPDLRQVRGEARLEWAATPFGVSVSSDGHFRYAVAIDIEGLPAPESLGDYRTYVAWAATPQLGETIKLGVVGNGPNQQVGTVAMNQFLVLISAEASPEVSTREGRLVLRGMSPSGRIQPDNHLMIPAGREATGHHGTHSEWPHPPMHPLVSMIPGLEDLRPGAKPFLPKLDEGEEAPLARPRELLKLGDGDRLDLVAAPVKRVLRGRTYLMYGFNGQYPGPLLQVEQSSTVRVHFVNRTPHHTAVHWHGVRLDNRFDGVPGVTQDPVESGGSFDYEIFFRDAGIYWYHPHHREDIQQDLGLFGNMLVRSKDPSFFNEVHREEVLMLDDLLIGDEGLFPYGEERATHALMGRFGNVLLVNGEPEFRLSVRKGEVVRFFLTNVANTRTFNLSFGGAPIKVVGSDLGKFEREAWAESVVIAPAERYIVEVRFEAAGSYALENRLQVLDHTFGTFFPERAALGTVEVSDEAAPPLARAFEELRKHQDVEKDLEPYRRFFDRPLDRELLLTLETEGLPAKLVRRMRADSVYFNPVEWTETMAEMNFPTSSDSVRWVLRDRMTGKENLEIDWRFSVGDVVKLRLVNDRDTLHAMQHPFHIHGQRFLVLSRNGVPSSNLVWKDTLLLAAGETADLLLEISNPGRWMAHCHIAEHLETGMKLVFTVSP